MKTFQLFSPVKELNGVLLIVAKQDENTYIRVLRGDRSLHHEFGIYIARAGDVVYVPIPGDAEFRCMAFPLLKNGSFHLVPTIQHWPMVSDTVLIKSIFDIGAIESMHFIAKAYIVQPKFTTDFIESLCFPAKEWAGDCMSLRRVLYTALRDANLAQTIYED